MRNYCITIFLLLLVSTSSVVASESSLDHNNIQWSRLVYEASAFFITLQSEVKQQSMALDSAEKQLVLSNDPNVISPGAETIYKVENYSEGFGKEARYTLWFDGNGAALQRKKLVSGKKNEIKIYRFSPCGYYTLRKKFPNKNFDKNFDQWKKTNKSFSEFSPELCGQGPVYDVNALMYLISALNIKQVGYEKEFLTFSDGRLLKVRLIAKKMTTVYGDFNITTPQKNISIDKSIDVLELHLTPITSNRKERDSFRFLGLKGNIKVYLDLTHRLIVRLRGKVDVVGQLDINLKKAELLR